MNYGYPLLNKVLEHYNNLDHDARDIALVCCQHLLEPQLEMFRQFIRFGFLPYNIFVLGKAYSANPEIAKEVADLGIQVRLPEFTTESFDDQHIKNCQSLFNETKNTRRIIVLDDGAGLIKVIIENKTTAVDFAVEQTSSGFRRLEDVQIDFPVVNVARSIIKLTQESPIIARLCYERIDEYVKAGRLSRPKFLIVGLGPIGEAIFQILEEDNEVEGFDIAKGHENLIGKIQTYKPDIIIGATGTSIINEEDLKSLEGAHPYHLISVSSSDREFPVAKHRQNNNIHTDVNYKNFIFVNNGFPVTFKANRNENTPAEIEKTIALLEGAVMHGVSKGYHQNGLLEIPQELEAIINS